MPEAVECFVLCAEDKPSCAVLVLLLCYEIYAP
jgi:hypothetical protein